MLSTPTSYCGPPCSVPITDAGPHLGVLRREGLAAWSRSLSEVPAIGAPISSPARQPTTRHAPAPSELTRLIASIVLAIAAEPAHV